MPSIAEEFEELRRSSPTLRARDAAERLGATEAVLVACGVTNPVTPLRPDWPGLIASLRTLGPVMALTQNAHAVHERHGRYEDVSASPGHILVLGPDIDLRLFPGRWAHAYALGGEQPSLQIFDRYGEAAHKVFATAATDLSAWNKLVGEFTASGAAPPPRYAVPAPPPEPEGLVDVTALRADWLTLRDKHDFVSLLRRHKASRRQALQLAGNDLALRVSDDAARSMLEVAAADGVPIMVFVGNRSAIQIHTGPVQRLRATPGWFNVLDPCFNLHLHEAGVASAWRVVKPTVDGPITSLELLNADGSVVAQIFGAREPGQPELAQWRELLADTLEPLVVPA